MPRTLGLMLGLALFTLLWRVLPHEMNMTPLFALAIFAGAKLNRFQAPLLVFATTALSDLVLGLHNTLLFVYAGLLLAMLVGAFLRRENRIAFYVGASLVTSTLFFLVSNLGVWLVGDLYPATAAGLWQCYVMAIPFFWKSLASDLFFTLVFFTLFTVLAVRPARTVTARS